MEDRQSEAHTLRTIGTIYRSLREYDKALDYLSQALELSRALEIRRGEAGTLVVLARVEHERGNLPAARAHSEAALSIIESVRGKVASQNLRASYLASNKYLYEFYVDLLMQSHKLHPAEGHSAAALEASERARARTLLDSLTEAGADIRQGVAPELLEREQSLQQQLNAQSERLTRLLGGKHSQEQAAAVKREVEDLLSQYREVQGQIRAGSPRYAALVQPKPLRLSEIQQQVLDDDTLLLEYALGDEHSYLWAVTPTSITSYELPKRAEIRAAAERAYKLLSSNNAPIGETNAATATLSQMLLGPVAGQLGTKRLLIVAEGELQYLPFAALPKPVVGDRLPVIGAKATGSRQPLIVDHEIVNLPSASTIAVLRRELSGRPPAAKAVAVLADPVFDRNDPRVKPEGWPKAADPPQAANPSIRFLERSAREVGLLNFDRLRSTRREAEAIVAMTREGESLGALDFKASRATATNEQLSQFRIVHFATHSLLNSQHPELSGVVLSLVDERGRPQDGFLRANEVYNLRLGADLVVLSGCQTALGKEVKGEGLVGLTRGFMYAGAPRVAASLWRVPDKATAELMKRFYEGMLAKGLRPAAALRAAQVDMLKEKRWAAPYYWAAFVLQGEWK